MTNNIQHSLQIEKIESVLFKSLTSNHSLETMLANVSTILNLPILLIDSSYTILVQQKTESISDPFWKDELARGYCPYPFAAYLNQLYTKQAAEKESLPFKVILSESPLLLLTHKLILDDQIAGTLVIFFTETSCPATYYPIITSIGQAIIQSLKKVPHHTSPKHLLQEDLLCDLLNQNYMQITNLKKHMETLDIYLEKNLYVLALTFSKNMAGDLNDSCLKKELMKHFGFKYTIYYNRCLIALYDKPYNTLYEDALKDFLNSHCLLLGISSVFHDLLDIHTYYLQAYNALALGEPIYPERTILAYKDIQYYTLFSTIDIEKEYIHYCHPDLLVLYDYDTKNHSNLYDILYKYLLCNCNTKETALQLSIHLTTLRSMLNKINTLVRIDFNSLESLSCLLISFHIFNYFKSLKLIDSNTI